VRRPRRNPDLDLRALERRFRATGDPRLAAQLRHGFDRAGILPPRDLWQALHTIPELAALYDSAREFPPRDLWRALWGSPQSEELRLRLEEVVFPWPTRAEIEDGVERRIFEGQDATIRLDDTDTAFIALVAEVTSYGPHPGTVAIDQNRYHGSVDTVLQTALGDLEDELRERHPPDPADYDTEEDAWRASRENIEYAWLGALPPREAAAAFVGTRWEACGAVEIDADVDEDYWERL
jgi:hypothetical protein